MTESAAGGGSSGAAVAKHLRRVEAELESAKDRLCATIEELAKDNEQLKSSNEGLQSANRELESSKEELQAVNDQLQTVNTELALRVADLGRANSDLKSLLKSTQIDRPQGRGAAADLVAEAEAGQADRCEAAGG
jgi:two-component system CheB/CheR fusion protein